MNDGAHRDALRMDRYAPLQLGREYDLTPTELYVMDALVRLVEKRGRVWTGTLTALGPDLRLPRWTVSDAIKRLDECGLVNIEKRFRGHANGQVRITSYDRWVVPWGGPETRTSARFTSQAPEGETRRKRGRNAGQSRESPRSQSGSDNARGTTATREEEVPPVEAGAFCPDCGEPIKGHRMDDHDPPVRAGSISGWVGDEFEEPF